MADDAADTVNADAGRTRRRFVADRIQLGFALAIFAGLAAVPLLATALDDPFMLVTAIRVMIFALAALSLDLLLGYGGMVSFGHAAFLGIGAYAMAIPAAYGFNDIALQLPAAIVASALFALVTGAISLRTRNVYFIMITLAFGQMAYFFMVSLSAYGGDDGMSLASRSTLFGLPVFANDTVFFYSVLGVLLAVFFAARAVIGSRFGRVLTGIRENSVRMEAIGFSPFRYQLTVYVIAAVIASVAGVLLANQTGFVSPAYMSWERSGELLVMVVFGGLGTLTGAIAGAVAFILLEDQLALLTTHWRLGLGLILIGVVLFTRGGLVRLVQRLARGQP